MINVINLSLPQLVVNKIFIRLFSFYDIFAYFINGRIDAYKSKYQFIYNT